MQYSDAYMQYSDAYSNTAQTFVSLVGNSWQFIYPVPAVKPHPSPPGSMVAVTVVISERVLSTDTLSLSPKTNIGFYASLDSTRLTELLYSAK